MPQQKINFKGALLDSRMPNILKHCMAKEEWYQFVREINLAIHDAQVTMKSPPWIILSVSCLAIMLVLLDMGLNGIFGNPQAGTVTLTVFVILALVGICYFSMGRPTKTLEECVEMICEHYSDEEREIYFFYRHHAQTRITENRFYIEVFVAHVPEKSKKPRKMEESCRALVPIQEEPEGQLVPLVSPPKSTALTLAAPAKRPNEDLLYLVPAEEDPSPTRAMVAMGVQPPAQELVPLAAAAPAPMPYTQSLVPAPAPAPMPYSHAVVPAPAPAPMPYSQAPDSTLASIVPAQPETSMVRASATHIFPQAQGELVPATSTRGSIALPPTQEDIAHAAMSAPPPTPRPPAMASAPPTTQAEASMVPAATTRGSIAPPPTQQDMVRAMAAPPPSNQTATDMVPTPATNEAKAKEWWLRSPEPSIPQTGVEVDTEALVLEHATNALALEHAQQTNNLQQTSAPPQAPPTQTETSVVPSQAPAPPREWWLRSPAVNPPSTQTREVEEDTEDLLLEHATNTLSLEHAQQTIALQQQTPPMVPSLAVPTSQALSEPTQRLSYGAAASASLSSGADQFQPPLEQDDTPEALLQEHASNALGLEHAQQAMTMQQWQNDQQVMALQQWQMHADQQGGGNPEESTSQALPEPTQRLSYGAAASASLSSGADQFQPPLEQDDTTEALLLEHATNRLSLEHAQQAMTMQQWQNDQQAMAMQQWQMRVEQQGGGGNPEDAVPTSQALSEPRQRLSYGAAASASLSSGADQFQPPLEQDDTTEALLLEHATNRLSLEHAQQAMAMQQWQNAQQAMAMQQWQMQVDQQGGGGNPEEFEQQTSPARMVPAPSETASSSQALPGPIQSLTYGAAGSPDLFQPPPALLDLEEVDTEGLLLAVEHSTNTVAFENVQQSMALQHMQMQMQMRLEQLQGGGNPEEFEDENNDEEAPLW